MKSLEKRIEVLMHLGEVFRDITSGKPDLFMKQSRQLESSFEKAKMSNPWFTPDSINMSIKVWGNTLKKDLIEKWIQAYKITEAKQRKKKVQVIMAGNIPLVGFHDFISTFITGHYFFGKLSSKDDVLLPLVFSWILNFDPHFENFINLSTQAIIEPDVIIATGSNNTSSLIKQKYKNHPNLIRHNRSSIAVLSGKESEAELKKLCFDIFSYFGLGCRNVSLILVPEDYDINKISYYLGEFKLNPPQGFSNAIKYLNAKSILSKKEFIHCRNILLFEEQNLNPPLGSVFYSKYGNLEDVLRFRELHSDDIQCVVGSRNVHKDFIPFGDSQKPSLNDYADGIDTIDFLLNN